MMHRFCPTLRLLLPVLLIVTPQMVHSTLANDVASVARSSASHLPAGLQNTQVDYPESRPTFVHFPTDAKPLLETEMAHIHSPLVLDVVTTVTHFKAPLWDLLKGLVHRFRNQNQIIYIRAHYYVGNGLTEQGCRIEWIDTDTGSKTERPVVSDQCLRQCTNGGRYCAPELLEVEEDYPFAPKLLVEETLRRLCIDDLYHASDLKHWEYLEAFEELKCFQQEDMTNCSKTALGQVYHTDWSAVMDCVQLAGGLDQDVMNVRLQEQLDRQQGSYSLSAVPIVHIAGTLYTGSWEVSSILDSVCLSYQDVYGVTPLACDFCAPCQDVRKCLWYLECDGTPFSVDTFQPGAFQQHQNNISASASASATTTTVMPAAATEAPIATTTAPPTPTEAPQSTTTNEEQPVTPTAPIPPPPAPTPDDSKQAEDDQADEETVVNTSGFFMGGILAGLVFGLAPAFYFSQHEKRTRREISAALAAREQSAALGGSQGSYHDDLALSSGKSRPTREELQNMEDITLEDTNTTNHIEVVSSPFSRYKDRPQPSRSRSRSRSRTPPPSSSPHKPTLGFKGGKIV